MSQIGAALFCYKLGQTLLQIGASFVTNWDSYYKLGQSLLQNRAAIINWGRYYKINAIMANWGITYILCLIIMMKNAATGLKHIKKIFLIFTNICHMP